MCRFIHQNRFSWAPCTKTQKTAGGSDFGLHRLIVATSYDGAEGSDNEQGSPSKAPVMIKKLVSRPGASIAAEHLPPGVPMSLMSLCNLGDMVLTGGNAEGSKGLTA